MLRARFLHLIMKHARSRNRNPADGVIGGHANHYTTSTAAFSISSERHRDKQSLMLRAMFLHLIMKHAWSGNRTADQRHATTLPRLSFSIIGFLYIIMDAKESESNVYYSLDT